MCSSHVNRLRGCAGMIFDLNPKWFEMEHNRADIPQLQALLKLNPEDPTYPVFPPILYSDLVVDIKNLFLYAPLPKILKVVFFGPSSLSSKSKAKPRTNVQLWGITRVTPGAVAFAAIMARFLVSPDTELKQVGSKSHINYQADFNAYKEILTRKAHTKSIKDLFNLYDKFVFSDEPLENIAAVVADSHSNSTDVADIMRLLDLEDTNDADGNHVLRSS
ncbi:hypothetical protein A0H81_05714 [Grifola frondosa]|uniref:Uncharacterized protein n=1 Tax=Grifola frondosa TaxID=5627 RepID=A0A1C7MBZ0_GRIFR|nr:hypothetical protein A0H81_05714 [Grifola frondosa]